MSDIHTKAIEERLEKALEFSNYRSTLNRQMQAVKLRFQNSLSFSKNGSTFKITPELISFVGTLITMGKEQGLLLDIHDKPASITDLLAFLDEITDIYYKSMNQYLAECKKLSMGRSVKALIEA